MRAAIVAVGSELLGTERLDTNSLSLTRRLEDHGAKLVAKAVVGDDEGRIADELRRWMGACDLVLVTGGLGPTADDRTRAALARASGRELARDPALVEGIRRKFERMGRSMPEVNARQGDVVTGAEALDNPRGTAPGQRLDLDECTVFLFPGVPHELEGLIDSALVPWLRERSDGSGRRAARVARIACLPESEVEERIAPLYGDFGEAGIALLPSPGEIELRLTAEGPEAESTVARMARAAAERLGDALYSWDEGDSLQAVVGRLLVERGETVATAESCTGGLVAERLTRVPGSSRYYLGSIVAYANEAKSRLMGVEPELFERHGAVSEEVAVAMAAGTRERLGASWTLSVTGIAGPGGGSDDKPVGTVFLGLAGADGARAVERRFPGDRERVRRLSSQWALDMLRREAAA